MPESSLRTGINSVPPDGADGMDFRRLLRLALVALRLPLADHRHLTNHENTHTHKIEIASSTR